MRALRVPASLSKKEKGYSLPSKLTQIEEVLDSFASPSSSPEKAVLMYAIPWESSPFRTYYSKSLSKGLSCYISKTSACLDFCIPSTFLFTGIFRIKAFSALEDIFFSVTFLFPGKNDRKVSYVLVGFFFDSTFPNPGLFGSSKASITRFLFYFFYLSSPLLVDFLYLK